MYEKYSISRLHYSNGSNLRLIFSKNTENTEEKSLEVTHEYYNGTWQDEQVAMPEIYKAKFLLLSLYVC
jgi:RNA-binding protein YlmH